MVGGNGWRVRQQAGNGRKAIVISAVPMHERRNRQQDSGLERVNPGEIQKAVAFALRIANIRCLLIRSVGHLKKIGACGSGKPQLIVWSGVENEGSKSADAIIVVVQRIWLRWHQSNIGAIRANAGVVGKSFGVIADTDLAVGGMKISVCGQQFDFAITFESRARNYVEHAISTVAVVGGVAATLDFDYVHILGIELRTDVRSDVGIGDRDTVDQPGNLMAAANVKLIVNHVRAGGVVGDEIEAVGARRSWSGLNCFTAESGLTDGG